MATQKGYCFGGGNLLLNVPVKLISFYSMQITTVNILKRTLTPSGIRKTYDNNNSTGLRRADSDSSVNRMDQETTVERFNYNRQVNTLSVDNVSK